jgi:hypothetical protein
MRQPLPYPPIYADEATMAALLCMGESTFRDYVRRKLLPEGVLIGSCRRWKVETVSKALDLLTADAPDADPVVREMKGYLDGQKKKGRPRAA